MEEKREDGLVRVMTRQEKMEYDDITIEDVSENYDGAKRPETFNEAYEDNSHRQQDFRQNFRSYGGTGHGPRVYSFNLGRGGLGHSMGSGLSTWQKWKYRLIGAVLIVAVLWFLIFVALPVAAIGVVVAMIAYMLYKFFA